MTPLDSSTVVTLGGILLVFQIVGIAVSIWSRLRRQPPIDQTLQDYVTRKEFDRKCEELRRTDDELRRTDGKLFDLVRELTERNATLQASISNQLGRLESSVSTLLKGLQK